MPASNLRFLVVEDHEFQRRVLVQLLQGLGAAAVHAADATVEPWVRQWTSEAIW